MINYTGDYGLSRDGATFDGGGMGGLMSGMMGMMAAQQQRAAAEARARAEEEAGRVQAAMYRTDAAQTMGEGTRQIAERARTDRATIGTARAMMGASGSSIHGSPTVMDVFDELNQRDAYLKATDLYQYGEKARKLEDAAKLALMKGAQGAAAARAQGDGAMLNGMNSIAKGLGGMLGKNGGGESLFSDQGGDTADVADSGGAYWNTDGSFSGWGND
jgi:hypothetical protein